MNTHTLLLIGILALSVPACGGVAEEKSLPDSGRDADVEPAPDSGRDAEEEPADAGSDTDEEPRDSGTDAEPPPDDASPDAEADGDDDVPDCEPDCDPPMGCESDGDCPPGEGCDMSGNEPVCVAFVFCESDDECPQDQGCQDRDQIGIGVCVPCPDGPSRWYPDCDLDAVGDSAAAVDSCFRPLTLALCDWLRTGGDCDDTDECCPNGRETTTCNLNAWRYACHAELGCLNTTTDEHCGEAYNACLTGSHCNEIEFIECRPTRCGDDICADFDNIPEPRRETPATCPADCN